MLSGRKKDIFDILCEKGKISVTELSKLLYVSEMTIRRDLCDLEKDGAVKRYRGGAVLAEINNIGIAQRYFVDESEKKQLGKRARKYLRSDMNVYIDSSSICQYIIPHMKFFKNITVITNSANALMIASKFHIPCFLIGGKYYERDMCFTGPIAKGCAEQFNVDIAFFSALGISDDGVISDDDIEQTEIRKIIMRNSSRNIFLFESQKYGKKYLYTLCRTEEADEILTVK